MSCRRGPCPGSAGTPDGLWKDEGVSSSVKDVRKDHRRGWDRLLGPRQDGSGPCTTGTVHVCLVSDRIWWSRGAWCVGPSSPRDRYGAPQRSLVPPDSLYRSEVPEDTWGRSEDPPRRTFYPHHEDGRGSETPLSPPVDGSSSLSGRTPTPLSGRPGQKGPGLISKGSCVGKGFVVPFGPHHLSCADSSLRDRDRTDGGRVTGVDTEPPRGPPTPRSTGPTLASDTPTCYPGWGRDCQRHETSGSVQCRRASDKGKTVYPTPELPCLLGLVRTGVSGGPDVPDDPPRLRSHCPSSPVLSGSGTRVGRVSGVSSTPAPT